MKKCFLLLLLLAALTSYSQNNRSGYIILSSGDTLRGTISYDISEQNPEFIQFSNGGNKLRYNISQLKEFNTGETVYTRFNITYQEAAIDLSEAKETYDGRIVSKDAWLKLLYKSTYSLYELSTAKRKYFFVLSAKDGIKELIYRARVGGDGSLEKDEQYKNLLGLYALEQGNEQTVQSKLANASYETDDLVDVFELLNSGRGSFKQEKTSKVLFDVSGGGTYYSFSTGGQLLNDGTGAYALYHADFKGSAGFLLGAGFTFTNTKNKRGVQSRMGINVGSVKIDGENNSGEAQWQNEKYDGNLLVVEPNISLDYSFIADENKNFSIGVVFAYNMVVSSDLHSTFTNPGLTVTRKDFPATKGGYLTGGGNATLRGNWGKINLAVIQVTNMFDDPRGRLYGTRFSLTYGYFLKK